MPTTAASISESLVFFKRSVIFKLMNNNQRGYGLIELLLLVIVVGVLGATGYYAIHTKHQTDKILDQSEKTSQSSISSKSNSSKSNAAYFTISQWNVRAPYNSKLRLQYSYSNDPESGEEISITSQELVSYGGDCASAVHYSIYKLAASDQSPPFDNNYQTVKDAYEKDPKSGIKLVGGYYYYGFGPQMYCGSTTDSNYKAKNAAQASMVNAAVAILEGLQSIPQ